MKEKNFKIIIYILIVILLLIVLGMIWYSYLPISTHTNQTKQENINNTNNVIIQDVVSEKLTVSNDINNALLKKYGYDEKIFEKYYSQGIIQGDSPNYEIIETDFKNNSVISGKIFEFNMAIVKDFLYPDNNDTLTNNLKIFKPLLLKERERRQNEENLYGNGISLPDLYISLNGFSIINNNKDSDSKYSRAKKIKVIINNSQTFTFELKDTNEVQLFDLYYKETDIGKPINAKFEVLETYEGSASNDIYIHEIGFGLSESGFGGR